MNREQARQEIRSRIKCADYLTKSKSGLYCCPYCGSGSGVHGTGALKVYDTNTWTCHACGKSGDVIDLYMEQSGCDYNTALSLMADEIGITIDSAPQNAAQRDFSDSDDKTPQDNAEAPKMGVQSATGANADYTAYYDACRKRISEPAAAAYLQSRGISPQIAEAYWLGFDPIADPAKAPGAMGNECRQHPCPRIIIPVTRGHYVARSIDAATQAAFKKMNPAGSTPGIFNARALYDNYVDGYQQDNDKLFTDVIFVTEGVFDALSLLEIGKMAIALNSAANAEKLIEMLSERRTETPLILCLDNDETGKRATETLKEGLQRLNICYGAADICAGHKDPNEALTADRDAFIDAVNKAQAAMGAKPDNTKLYIDSLMYQDIEKFKDEKKTGFKTLDEKSGGLHAGLYVIPAISSIGKTSFGLQLADQLAEGGHDIIYFSLEQSRLELVSKSLARRTAQKNMTQAVTSLAIRKGYLPPQVLEAVREYKEAVSDRISIVEGNFSCDISFIGNYIRQYMRRNGTAETGRRPIVFIDYLQILQPADDKKRQSTKEMVDTTVTELKRISRAHDLTLFVISSVNRANYLTPIDFESLKESGGIEYTADVIWGLQLQCLNDELFSKDRDIKKKREMIKAAKAANPRKIELSCLKNRYGIANFSCYFNYYPANDLFTECSSAELDFIPITEATPKAGRKL